MASASKIFNSRSLAIFHNPHFLDLSETMVTMIMARNLEIPEIHKFEAMLKWAKNYIKNQGHQNRADAKADFRACMDRLSRDLKLYRISPQVKLSNICGGHPKISILRDYGPSAI